MAGSELAEADQDIAGDDVHRVRAALLTQIQGPVYCCGREDDTSLLVEAVMGENIPMVAISFPSASST
jgi:hypothetical protein